MRAAICVCAPRSDARRNDARHAREGVDGDQGDGQKAEGVRLGELPVQEGVERGALQGNTGGCRWLCAQAADGWQRRVMPPVGCDCPPCPGDVTRESVVCGLWYADVTGPF